MKCVLLLSFLGSVILVFVVIALVFYLDAKQYAVMKMKFPQFQSIYQTSPGSWSLDTLPQYHVNYSWETISLSLIDWFKYLTWRNKKHHNQKLEHNNEVSIDIIENWLKDCERFRKKNETA